MIVFKWMLKCSFTKSLKCWVMGTCTFFSDVLYNLHGVSTGMSEYDTCEENCLHASEAMKIGGF